MNGQNWIELILFLTALTLITKPLGIYLYKVLEYKEKTPLDFLFKPLEKITYKLLKIDPEKEHSWKQYALHTSLLTIASGAITLLFLSLQSLFPLNSEHMANLSLPLSLNIAISYLTNTDLNCYSPETTLSYFSQMVPLTLQNFLSPAIGMAVAAALTRGIVRYSKKTLGNFYVDVIRVTYYVLIPISLLLSILFIAEGVPQNFKPPVTARTLESQQVQTIIQGPIASRDAIKIVGTNGGAYTNTDSAHPYENPTPFTNLLQVLFILALPAAQTYYFGKKVKNRKHGWSLYFTMLSLFALGAILTTYAESSIYPTLHSLNIEPSGNLEGKELRLGIFGSSLFSCATTAASNGATNASLDSFTPLGILTPLLNMQLGEVIFGGVGAGLYNMLLFVIFTVFTVGLIIGKTPEYLGNKIAALDIKLVIIAFILFIVNILGFTAYTAITHWATSAQATPNPHVFTQLLYTFSSAASNNGSSLTGLSLSSLGFLFTTAISMLLGRFLVIFPVLAIAGSFGMKNRTPPSTDSFPVSGFTFVILLILSIVLIGALSFLPSLVMGPFLEHFDFHLKTLF